MFVTFLRGGIAAPGIRSEASIETSGSAMTRLLIGVNSPSAATLLHYHRFVLACAYRASQNEKETLLIYFLFFLMGVYSLWKLSNHLESHHTNDIKLSAIYVFVALATLYWFVKTVEHINEKETKIESRK
jgi:hypothetical protein